MIKKEKISNTQLNIIETKNLRIGYFKKKKPIPLVTNIDISIKKGTLVGILGKNGIGKSTFIKTLTKVIPPLSGEIEIDQKKLKNYSASELAKKISVVLTEKIPSKNFSVLELITIGRHPYTNWIGKLSPKDISVIEEVFQKTELNDLKHRKCNSLSDGQLQKVMIARALAQDTDIIILDEPTLHLDLHKKVDTLNLLQKLTRTLHKTILFSSHNLEFAIQLCDAIVLMTSNKIKFGTPKELIAQGAFEELFPKDLIRFNPTTQRFSLQFLSSSDH